MTVTTSDKKDLAIAATDFLISNQLTLLRLSDTTVVEITLSVPTANGILEEDLINILSDKFSSDKYKFEFEYIKSKAANGITIIHVIHK